MYSVANFTVTLVTSIILKKSIVRERGLSGVYCIRTTQCVFTPRIPTHTSTYIIIRICTFTYSANTRCYLCVDIINPPAAIIRHFY